MQRPIYGDMEFRSNGMSEDCLYLNVWTPNESAGKKPVLVYFFGGGLVAGDASEYRYDGESMASKGIVSVTVNYRLTVFGFLAHPELTAEAPYHASGNYGFLESECCTQVGADEYRSIWRRSQSSHYCGPIRGVAIRECPDYFANL